MQRTLKANFPLKSYIPQESIKERVSRTARFETILSWVNGQIPPLANVAAITARESVVTEMEHN